MSRAMAARGGMGLEQHPATCQQDLGVQRHLKGGSETLIRDREKKEADVLCGEQAVAAAWSALEP